MAVKPKRPSPILSTAISMIGEASDALVSRDSRFRHTFEAPLDRLRPDPNQPRKRFDDAEIAQLAATMEAQGQLQPVLVRRDPEQRGAWILVAGERRWRAARLNGWTALLAIEHGDDPEVASLLENLQRVDLSPVEEARGVQRLIDGKGWSQNEAARVLGKSKGEVSATLRILTLPEAVLEAVQTSELDIPRNALVELARVEEGPVRDRLIALAREGALTVRAIRQARGELAAPAPALPPAPASVGAPAAGTASRRRSPTSRPLDLRAVEALSAALVEARGSGRAFDDVEREALERLAAEIAASLQQQA